MPQVSLSGVLSDAAGGAASIKVEAATIRELLRKLVERYPGLAARLDDVAVSVNGEIYRDRRDVAIPPDAEVFLLPRIQGG